MTADQLSPDGNDPSDVSTLDEAAWRKRLSPTEYVVLREAATERAFTGEYVDCHDDGTYRCRACANPLFSSDTKFESGSGWPSFFDPLTSDAVTTRRDRTHGMERVEVLCSNCGSHLGHVFPDGPGPTGLRYCMNSVALDLDRATASADVEAPSE
jgi:peptide-methionine (R)-S-oxide reductase